MLKAIHAQEDRAAAEEKVIAVTKKLRSMKLSEAAHLVEKGAAETLSYYAFPSVDGNAKMYQKWNENCTTFQR